MMSLLIVDDEARIADSLYCMVQEAFQERLAVRRCYSAAAAQALMEKMPIHILMTDINMPNISGLELHRWVSGRWPMTRVIYLTGYSDFEYVRAALDSHAQAYLLKSDGDERIIAAIEAAMRSIDAESDRLLSKAQAAQARPMFLRQLALRLICGRPVDREALAADMQRWNIGLDADRPLLMAHCFPETQSMPMDAIASAIDELMAGSARRLVADVSARRILVLCQTPSEGDADELSGLLEEAQRILEIRGQRLTVALFGECIPWDQVSAADAQLLERVSALGPGPGELARLNWDPDHVAPRLPSMSEDWEEALDCIRNMHDYLLTGQRDAYFEEEEKLVDIGRQKYSTQLFSLIFDSTVMNLRSAAAGLELSWGGSLAPEVVEFDPAKETMLGARVRLDAAAERIFAARGSRANSRMRKLMKEIDAYIEGHLSDELSLTALADRVHFHPVYLSRMYKETMGVSLSDHIAEARMNVVCGMLKDTCTPISEISRQMGFSSANYFARWFKKRMGITPQEYRERR